MRCSARTRCKRAQAYSVHALEAFQRQPDRLLYAKGVLKQLARFDSWKQQTEDAKSCVA